MAEGEWRARSDAAQVAANYLRCHPKVADVRYPGLTTDGSYREASSTLRGGFGPFVWVRVADEPRWRLFEADADDALGQVMGLESVLATL